MANPVYTKKSVVYNQRNNTANEQPNQNAVSDLAVKTINIQPNVNITTFLHRLPTVAPKLGTKLTQLFPGIEGFTKSRLLTNEKKENIKLKIKSLQDFPACIKHLQIKKWVIDQERGVIRDSLNREQPFSKLESTFKEHEERFRLFLKKNDLRYDSNSGLLVLKDELLPFEESNAVMKYFIAQMGLEDQKQREKSISPKTDSFFIQISEAPKILKNEAVHSNYELKEKKTRLTLKAYMYFEYTLALLQTQEWVIIQGEPNAIDPLGRSVPIADLKTKFFKCKESFTQFLANKKLSYDASVEWLMGATHIPTLDQTCALIDEFIEWEKKAPEENFVVTLKRIMEFDVYLEELKARQWTVDDYGNCIGPHGEFFTYQDMHDGLFEPRKNQFRQNLKNNGYNYDNSLGVICKGNSAVDLETAESLVRKFIMGEKAKIEALRRQSPDLSVTLNNNQQFPDYKEVKEVLTLMLNFEKTLSKLVEWGWKVNTDEGYVLTPEGTPYNLEDVKAKWEDHNMKFQKLAGFDSLKMDQVFETFKDPILNELVKMAVEYKMPYDKEMNLFTDGENAKTIEQMMITLTLNELELY